MSRLVLWAALLAPVAAWAGAYEREVDLVDELYLYQDQLSPADLLAEAAHGLAREIDWLFVEADGSTVSLSHGSGAPIGSVSVSSFDTLPAALASLEELVESSGYPLDDDLDVRLALLSGTTDALDRYSRVLTGRGLERFDVRLKGTLEGIGATLRVESGKLRVRALVHGGPADLGGLQVGDVILRIDGVSTLNLPLSQAVRRVRGASGSVVELVVERDGVEQSLALTRAEVVVPTVTHEVLPGPVGYVRLDHFSQRTEENLILALDELREQGALARGLIIDLRGNTGGSMKESARIADRFIDEGVLLRTTGPDGGRVQNLQARMDARPGNDPDVPLVLLVDERTASGSEILAGALLELRRAALVGTRTFGKGTVQKIYPIDDGVRLKLTVARYVLANERLITEGIVPDVTLADITLDGYGARYSGWHEGRAGVSFDQIVPVVHEREEWRGHEVDPGDVGRELARRAVLRARGSSRRDVLLALDEVVREARTDQERALTEALEARGIDWSPAEADAPPPRVHVDVRAFPDPEREDVAIVQVEVENLDDAPLARTLVQLECDTFGSWDGLVVPVGRVPVGDTALGSVAVPLRAGLHPREDPVEVVVRTDRRDSRRVGTTVLAASSSERPRLRVEAHLAGEGPERRAELVLHNLTGVPVRELEASFAHPGDLDVELLEASEVVETLGPHGQASLGLSLRVGDDAPEVLPLTLEVEADRYRWLLQWPLDLPADGSVVQLQAPVVTADAAVSAPVGPYTLTARVLDDGAVDHVVVYSNDEKVAWAAGDGGSSEVRAELVLDAGVNRIAVVAEDDQGLRHSESWRIRGEPTEASVDADTEDAQ